MKTLAQAAFWKLGKTGLFRSKPLLAPLLRALWRYLFARTPEAGAAAVDALAAGRLARYPILFHDRHGLEYLLYPDQNPEIFIANNGNYEIGETEFCLARLRPGMTVFDVGAHIGLYTLLFARQVGPGGRVHAFEPEPRNREQLLVNLAINRCDNVTVNPLAVFSKTQPVTLNIYSATGNALHTLRQAPINNHLEPGRTLMPERQATVQATSLDDYCREHGIENIDYLKIDVEGAELDVLHGARGLLQREAVSLIQFEALAPLHSGPPADMAQGDVFTFLRGHGFACHPITPSGQLGGQVAARVPGYSNYAAVRA